MHKTAFIFGKFYPLHSGHLELLRFARSQCERLVVLVCCSQRETIAPQARVRWFSSLRADPGLEARALPYDESVYPNTSVPSLEVARKWAELFKVEVPEATLLVTSEPYGELVAGCMGIAHLGSRPPRPVNGVSDTALRADLAGHWDALAPDARRYFQKTIVILGTESTGKTTLAQKLAAHFGAALVQEVGRELIPDSNQYSRGKLHQVAMQHARNIVAKRNSLAPVVIVDTDVYTTQSYARFAGGDWLDLAPQIYECNRADLRLYLGADAPFHQDGTRLDETRRNALDRCHRDTLLHFEQQWIDLRGTYAAREAEAIRHIQRLFEVRWRDDQT